ncbi:MAG: O-antigen ligase family protein [Rhodocyclaceae bacterium]|nr:O-antigen ligase family protein [Rhodocyclaceae bacterium]
MSTPQPNRFFSNRKLPTFTDVSLVVALVVISLLTGLAIGLNIYFVLPIVFLPALLMVSTRVVDVEAHAHVLASLGLLAFAVFVLWPRYSYLRFGYLPGVTPSRLVLAIWFVVWASFWLRSPAFRQNVSDWLRASGGIGWLVAFVLGWRFFGNLFADNPLQGTYVLANEVVSLGLIFLLASVSQKDRAVFPRFAHVLGLVSMIVCLLALIEYWWRENLFVGILPITDDYAAQALSAKIRDAGYRAQSTFDHPLTLAQFLVTAIPLMAAMFLSAPRLRMRMAWGLVILAAIAGVVVTGTRSAVAVSIASAFSFAVLVGMKQIVSREISLRGLLATIASIAAITLGVFAVSDHLIQLALGRTAAEVSSSSARLIMLERAWPVIMDSPVFGHGVGRAAELVGIVGANRILTVDSLVISFAVESGLIVLFAYVALMVVGMVHSVRSMAIGGVTAYWGAGLSASLFAFFLTTVTLSLTGNLFLLAFLLAMVVALRRNGSPE